MAFYSESCEMLRGNCEDEKPRITPQTYNTRMTKKRFVEFYLAACIRAATGGRVSGLGYLFYDLDRQEVVVVHFSDGERRQVPITDSGLPEIMQSVLAGIA